MAVEWTILGATQGIRAYCDQCRVSFHIENPSPTVSIKHCGLRTRLPEKVYERWTAIRETLKKDRPYSLSTGRYI